eukprot:1817173-Alexandrium_andersonii.AAC.1
MVSPPLIWLMRRARPYLEIHVLVENTPDIGELRRAAMKKMLAVTEHEWVVLKSSTLMKQRSRCLLYTSPSPRD